MNRAAPTQAMCDFPGCYAQASRWRSPTGFSWRQPSPDPDAAAGATAFDTETVKTCAVHEDASPGILAVRIEARTTARRNRLRREEGRLL